MNQPPGAEGRDAGDGRRRARTVEWSALGLSAEDQALLAKHREEWPAVGPDPDSTTLWARIEAERASGWRLPLEAGPRRGALVRLAWWQVVAQPGRLVAPALAALLLIAGELFTTLLPHRPVGLDLWAIMAPWLGFWAVGRGGAEVVGVVDAWTRIAPLSAARARTARWVGAALTGVVALAIALGYGGLADTAQLGRWAAEAGVGFSASLALGLAGSALLPPRRLNGALTALGVANFLAVVIALTAGRPEWVPVLALLRAPVAVWGPLGAAVLAFGLWRARGAGGERTA
ncbi:MAG: hypothetical protein M0Z54_03760 [Thermaerobacter sp.]|nr:hypothetical protein [Thermaerobacter sp.]